MALQKAGKSVVMTLSACTIASVFLSASAVQSSAETRALKIYHLHTHEKATIVFKRNGRYDAAGLKKLNVILRDWRRNEPVRMDPRLFDLLWEVYQKSGSNDYVNVVCGYRAPETNSMLRSRSKGVAEKSQHVQGKAMDFFIPGVKLAKLREIGMKFQVGGVGFYPRSGSPFVHMDVGSVRSWPRMSRTELARLFPDGRTLHQPAQGGPMPGYSVALADYKKRVGSNAIMVAGGGSNNDDGKRRKGLLASLFGGGGDENEEEIVTADIQTASAAPAGKSPKAQEQQILTATPETEAQVIAVNAPVPGVRPAFRNSDDVSVVETALVSPQKSAAEEAMQVAMAAPLPEEEPKFANLSGYKIPVPNMLGNRRQGDDAVDDIQTASADPMVNADDGSYMPVPEERPRTTGLGADALAAVASADIIGDEEVPQPPTNDEVAALAQESSVGTPAIGAATDEDEADLADSLDAPVSDNPANGELTELASLQTSQIPLTRSFALPDEESAGAAVQPEFKPHKGGRPKKSDAQAAALSSVYTEPKLTGNVIAKWALTNGRLTVLSKPVKAPRFVSASMRAQPTTVYSAGFSQESAEIDPARFSGSSVNFPAIKKFSSTN